MATLALPEPYDFARSTERYRAFGPDLANLWHEGGVHRVFDGREIRIEAAEGGVDVEPFESRALHYLGRSTWMASTRSLRAIVCWRASSTSCAGCARR